jgi:Domain of unknown function (DUF4157)
MHAHAAGPHSDRLHRCGDHACPPDGCGSEQLDRSAVAVNRQPTAPRSVYETIASPGQLLDRSVRQKAESWFGADLSAVQVHVDAAAQRSASDVDARAYTVGEHVVFGTGQYQPTSEIGSQTLTHELVHVLQQRGPVVRAGSR